MTSRRAQAATILAASFVQGLVSSAFPASATVLRARGLSDAEYGSIFLPQVSLAAAGALLAGAVLGRLGAKRGLALGIAVMGLSQAVLAAIGIVPPGWGYLTALLGTSLLGLGAGIAAGPLNAYPQALFPARGESAVVALHTVIGVGLAVTPVLAGAALALDAWPAVPLLLLGAHAFLFVAVEREDLPEPEPRPAGRATARPLGDRSLWLFLAVVLLYGVTESVHANWAVVFLTEERGLGAPAAGLALAAFWAALTIGRLTVAAALLWVHPPRVLPVLAALMAAACLFVPLARSPRGAVVVFALAGAGCSAVFPLTVGLAGRLLPDHRAWVSAALFAALVAGLGLGSLGAGLLHARLELSTIYRLAALPPALAAALALRAAAGLTRAGGEAPAAR